MSWTDLIERAQSNAARTAEARAETDAIAATAKAATVVAAQTAFKARVHTLLQEKLAHDASAKAKTAQTAQSIHWRTR